MKRIWMIGLALVAGAQEFVVFPNPGETPPAQLKRYLNRIGAEQLRARDSELAQVRTREDMERRKKMIREKILRLVGGLPDYRGPLNTKQAGTLRHDDYRIEKIVYESLPGFFVPANVYVPLQGAGPFPAILNPVGHGAAGKASEREIAVGLVKKGFIVLKYDPIGQGERLQYYDPDLKASKVGGPTDEHTHAGGHTMLIGDNVARYRIWDGMRGIDYLLTRKDVDANRIGCTGCSGGGTLTTYISALDERVKVAAPSCYMNSWQEMLEGPGPQDGEQSLPRFLAEGLNFGDYVELFAPKPWLNASTIEDFFPLEGARQTFEEARRIYSLYGAEERLGWYVGPGGHGVPRPSREAIYAWFVKWLKNGEGDRNEAALDLDAAEELLVTPTGQVSDSLGGETVFTINKKRAAQLMQARQAASGARLVSDVRQVAAIAVEPGGPAPRVKVHSSVDREGYRLDVISIETEGGIRLPGLLAVPAGDARKPALLIADATPNQTLAQPGGDVDELARAGRVVLVVKPRGIPETPQAPARSSPVAGHGAAALAHVVGKTLAGMRAEDIIRAVDFLGARADVDPSKLAAAGRGALGVALLHAAVVDQRIREVVLQDTLALYRLAIERPLHRGLYDVALPGVLLKYDLDDLLAALAPRPVTVVAPVDQLGVPMLAREFRQLCGKAPDARVVQRGALRGLLR
ncbi:MAG: acetylxylan esterase [Bryobacterales bacterium]|nr:acetylxylan esterase [Bryobacterales bacterium]